MNIDPCPNCGNEFDGCGCPIPELDPKYYPTPECETCNGTGKATTHEKHYVDEGTRWRRLVGEEWPENDCPDCDGPTPTEGE